MVTLFHFTTATNKLLLYSTRCYQPELESNKVNNGLAVPKPNETFCFESISMEPELQSMNNG